MTFTSLFLATLGVFVVVASLPAAVAFVLLAPRRWEGAAHDKAQTRISPLWFLLTLGFLGLPSKVVESHMLAILVAQLVVAIPFAYLHRRWPWSTIVLCAAVIVFTGLSLLVGSIRMTAM